MTSVATDRELIEAVVGEMHDGIERAAGFWMAQIEDALHDPRLTTLGRMLSLPNGRDRMEEMSMEGQNNKRL